MVGTEVAWQYGLDVLLKVLPGVENADDAVRVSQVECSPGDSNCAEADQRYSVRWRRRSHFDWMKNGSQCRRGARKQGHMR